MNTNQLLHQELLGAIELTSESQALDLAGRLFNSPARLTSIQFADAVEATLFAHQERNALHMVVLIPRHKVEGHPSELLLHRVHQQPELADRQQRPSINQEQ